MTKSPKIIEKGHAIAILTSPTIPAASAVPLENLITILQSLFSEIVVITSDKYSIPFETEERVEIHGICYKDTNKRVSIILNYLRSQYTIIQKLFKVKKKTNIILFFFGETLIIPLVVSKFLGLKVLIILPGNLKSELARNKRCGMPLSIIGTFSRFSKSFCDEIILYSHTLIAAWGLEKHRDKILIAPRHFIDFDKFKIKKEIDKREYLVGYIGRLNEEKGILNFVEAIPEILKERSDLKFLICGDGWLCDKIKKRLSEGDLNDKVELAGWIDHNSLPDYLNKLKLVVLPSYTEGLPNLILEAMACGTPVLATPVGAIPDIIMDGNTGFTMKNNSPACIAKSVVRALERPDIEIIVGNAKMLVEREFTYDVAVERYRGILGGVQ